MTPTQIFERERIREGQSLTQALTPEEARKIDAAGPQPTAKCIEMA